jgi:uncharacterized protein YndB with AHSA1/START domain
MRSFEQPSTHEVVFARYYQAPPERVWKAWSELDQLEQWYGPDGYTITTQEFSFTPGGSWRFVMHGPDGRDNPNLVVFREIVPARKLVYQNSWELPGAPVDFILTVSFTPRAGGTQLRLHMDFGTAAGMQSAITRYGVVEGGTQTLERLAGLIGA